MEKINWGQKLSSRKFWAAIIGFVTALLFAFGVKEPTVEQVTALITAMSALVAYIVGEGLVDASRNNRETLITNVTEVSQVCETEEI